MKDNIKYCKELITKHGKSYSLATKFFPKKLQDATYVLYAFYRIPDDIVDVPNTKTTKSPAELLQNWSNAWDECIKTGKSYHPVLEESYRVHKTYNIDFRYSQDFLKAMKQDLAQNRYQNFDELKSYMYGSAAVVGIMMTHVIGTLNKQLDSKTLELAASLGYGMQLTNFLRDIKEDLEIRNRIYLPIDDLQRYEISTADIEQKIYPKRFKEFMEFQLERAENFYNEAEKGIENLTKSGRFAVKFASNLYLEYHRLIRESNYQVFDTEYKIYNWRKFIIFLKSL